MDFCFLTNETEEVINLINKVFDKNGDINSFKLLDTQKVLLLKDKSRVIGATIITLKHDPIMNLNAYYLDYVCIDTEYQHQGLGRKMFEEIVKDARNNGIDYIELTSGQKRQAARKMYMDCGMTIKDTDVFLMKL